MEPHFDKNILLSVFISLCSLVKGQSTTPPETYNDFIKKTKTFNAVKLTVHKTEILYNSFDRKETDTTHTIDTIYGIRKGKKLQYFIEGKVRRNGNNYYPWNHIYIHDSLAYSYDTSSIWRLDQDEIRHLHFPDCYTFLGDGNDTLLWFQHDTFVNNADGGFTHIHHFKGSEYGPQTSIQTFQLDCNGVLTGKHIYTDQENTLPKFYTEIRYSDITYYKKAPRFIVSKVKTEIGKAVALYQKKKKR